MANDQTVYGAATYGGGVYSPYLVAPDPLGDTETTGAAGLAQVSTTAPLGLTDAQTVTGPTGLTTTATITPASLTNPETVGSASGATSNTLVPTSITDAQTITGPALTVTLTVTPASVTNPQTLAGPYVPAPNFAYSYGIYGAGTYSGQTVGALTPDSVFDPETITSTTTTPDTVSSVGFGSGLYGAGIYPGTNQQSGVSVTDPETIGQPTLSGAAVPATAGYGGDTYGQGTYTGSLPNPGGAATPVPASVPLVDVIPPALHILGVGPWNPVKAWRGARNYGIGKGLVPARPQLRLPGVTSKSFTLRLDGGNEASVGCSYPRGAAMIVEELATDLWWQRRDPRTGKLESIARFNCSSNDLSYGTDGMLASSLQFQDYFLILGQRMVLKYLTTVYEADGKTIKAQQSQWAKGSSVTSILKWAIPTNTGIDLSALDDPDLLGVTKDNFEIPPSATIADVFKNVEAIASLSWEWWVDTPADVTLPPKLTFAIGQRGRDRGVTLFDFGLGPSPIAGWTMRATSDTYANAMYFQGKTGTSGGGVIVTNPAQITAYGQRDTKSSDSTVTGSAMLFRAAAERALKPLGDRRPTFTITLRAGFWRGRAHIDVGDTVRLRIRLGAEDLSYEYRVSEIQVDVDDAGGEQVQLTLGTPLPSANPRSKYSPTFRLVRYMRNYEPSDHVDTSTWATDPSDT